MMYSLPTSVTVNGTEYAIRSDYRPILDILDAIADPELNDEDKAEVMLRIFYPDVDDIPTSDLSEAVDKCIWFINCGEDKQQDRRGPKLMDWGQDFSLIAAPINRVLGKEVRAVEYLHFWTFIGAYQEIGDCTFAQVVNIRRKKAKGQKLDKSEQAFYRANRQMVDFKRKYTAAEDAVISKWI